jgi:cytochrome bd-type quinol oxidase subunit 2
MRMLIRQYWPGLHQYRYQNDFQPAPEQVTKYPGLVAEVQTLRTSRCSHLCSHTRTHGADWLQGSVTQLAYLVVLMSAPVVGASAVTYSQRRAPQEERRRVLIPYALWASAGLVSILLLLLASTNPRRAASVPPDVVTFPFWAAYASMWIVPVVVPLLRTLIWLVSPPVIRSETEARGAGP